MNIYKDIFLGEYSDNYFGVQEIEKEFERINKHKAVGYCEMDYHIFNNLTYDFKKHIAMLFSSYWVNGYFPSEGKLNMLVNIPKGKKEFTPQNSRPITLVPMLQRVYQKLIRDQITSKLDKHIPNSQYGFMPKRSTILAINQFLHEWNTANRDIHRKHYVLFLFLDGQKAFNSLLPFQLFKELAKINNLSFYELAAIINLQCGNQYFIKVGENHYTSDTFEMNIGINQGTTLLPKEFIFYMKEVAKWIIELNEMLNRLFPGQMWITDIDFADDLIIPIHYWGLQQNIVRAQIRNIVSQLSQKLLEKNIKLNYEKFEYITNDKRLKRIFVNDDVELEAKKVIRVYGIHFNVGGKKLYFKHNFNIYYEHLIKMTNLADKLSKINKTIKGHVMNNIVKSYVNGKIDYGSEIIQFNDTQFRKLDTKWRIFIKGQYGIKKTSLNYTIYLLSSSYKTEDRHACRKISHYLKTKFINIYAPTKISIEIINGTDECDLKDVKNARFLDLSDLAYAEMMSEGTNFAILGEQMNRSDFYGQIEILFGAAKPTSKLKLFDAIKIYIKRNATLRYQVAIGEDVYSRRITNAQLCQKVSSLRNTCNELRYDVRNEVPNFKITGINWIRYWWVDDTRSRLKLNYLTKYYKAYAKLFTNAYRLGIWIKSMSRYIIEEEELYACSGYCVFCSRLDARGNPGREVVEDDIHFLNCPYYSEEKILFQSKLGDILGQIEGAFIIDQMFQEGEIDKIVYSSSYTLMNLGLNLTKNMFEQYDLVCKQFVYFIRKKRSNSLIEIQIENRNDVLNVDKYRELIINKLRTKY